MLGGLLGSWLGQQMNGEDFPEVGRLGREAGLCVKSFPCSGRPGGRTGEDRGV